MRSHRVRAAMVNVPIEFYLWSLRVGASNCVSVRTGHGLIRTCLLHRFHVCINIHLTSVLLCVLSNDFSSVFSCVLKS